MRRIGQAINQSRKVRSLLVVLICLLTLYGPAELTRVIIAWDLSGQFIFEVFFVWVLYAVAMSLVAVLLLWLGYWKKD